MRSTLAQLGFLSLASTALAHPHVRHHEGHIRYAGSNSTGIFPTGTGTGFYPTASHGHGHGHSDSPTTTSELTTTIRLTSTIVQTVVVKPSSSAAGNPAPAGNPVAEDVAPNHDSVCAAQQVITQTVTDRVTITVTPSPPAAPSSSSSASSSAAEEPSAPPAPAPAPAPSTSEQPAAPAPPAYTPPPVTPKPVEAPQPKEEEPKAVVAPQPAPPTVAEPPKPAAPVVEAPKPAPPVAAAPAPPKEPAAPAPAPPKEAPAPSGNGKRGLLYNDVSLTKCFAGAAPITWAYNWAVQPGGDLPSGVNFIPMLWGTRPEFDLKDWATNIEKQLGAGATHIFGFNEPDHGEQAKLSPGDAAAAWQKYLEPYAGRAKLISPAVTNGPAESGMGPDGWLKPFLEACSSCTIEAVACHWYDSATNIEYFKKYMENARDIAGGRKVWLTEFGASGSQDQIIQFLDEVLPWMDAQDWIEGYSYFKVDQGLLVEGNDKNAVGRAYAGQ